MNAIELEELLRRIQGYDNRELTEDGARAWAEQLARVPFALAAQAVVEHFREEPDKYLTPGHVYQRARALYEVRQREAATATRAAAEERSDAIRQAALERKAADLGTRVATPEEAEAYGKGALRAVMQAMGALVRSRGDQIPKGLGVAAAEQALAEYQAKHGRAPLVDRRRQPCGNPHCVCTHEEPCEAGWMPVDAGDPAAAVSPCPVCKPRAATIIDNAKGARREAQALLRDQGKADKGGDEW